MSLLRCTRYSITGNTKVRALASAQTLIRTCTGSRMPTPRHTHRHTNINKHTNEHSNKHKQRCSFRIRLCCSALWEKRRPTIQRQLTSFIGMKHISLAFICTRMHASCTVICVAIQMHIYTHLQSFTWVPTYELLWTCRGSCWMNCCWPDMHVWNFC